MHAQCPSRLPNLLRAGVTTLLHSAVDAGVDPANASALRAFLDANPSPPESYLGKAVVVVRKYLAAKAKDEVRRCREMRMSKGVVQLSGWCFNVLSTFSEARRTSGPGPFLVLLRLALVLPLLFLLPSPISPSSDATSGVVAEPAVPVATLLGYHGGGM